MRSERSIVSVAITPFHTVPIPHLHHHLTPEFSLSSIPAPNSSTPEMWDDQPVQRKAPPVDMPPSTRAFLSQFNRSFTPPALINDPFAVDRKLVITPLLLGPRPLYVSKNPFAVDPAVERVRHYVGCEELTDPDLRPSPTLPPVQDREWISDDEDRFTDESNETSVCIYYMLLTQTHFTGRVMQHPATSELDNGTNNLRAKNLPKYDYFGRLDLTKATITGELPLNQPRATKVSNSTSRDQVASDPQSKWQNQPTKAETGSLADPWDEWNEPSDSGCYLDAMIAAEDRFAVEYDSLL